MIFDKIKHSHFINVLNSRPTLVTLVIGALGAFLMSASGGPVPFITGPALIITIVCFLGIRAKIPLRLRDVCFVIIGMSMGAGVTPEVLQSAKQWPVSFIVLTLSIILIVVIGRKVLALIWNYDPMTALLAVIPGHLSYVLGLSTETKADLSTISIVQSIRVLALTFIVPIVVVTFNLESSDTGPALAPMSAIILLVLIVVSALLGFIFNRMRLPAAYLIAGLMCSTAGHLFGVVEGPVVNYVALPAFVVLGCLLGTRFSGVSWQQFRNALKAGIMTTFIGVVIAILGSWIVSELTNIPLNQLLIAFAPGGVETMSAMSISMDVDSTFVAAHHVTRLMILTFLAPYLLRSAQRESNEAPVVRQ